MATQTVSYPTILIINRDYLIVFSYQKKKTIPDLTEKHMYRQSLLFFTTERNFEQSIAYLTKGDKIHFATRRLEGTFQSLVQQTLVLAIQTYNP